MDITKSSPYAAPNTPIASSKRPRISTKELKSPSIKTPSALAPSPKDSTGKELNHNKININNKSSSSSNVPPATPSKIMFSPGLRNADGTINTSNNNENANNIEVESISYNDKESDNEEEDDVFNPYLFIAGLPNHSSVTIRGKICLPPLPTTITTPKITLALDLDETLVHCTVEPINKPDLVFPVSFNGMLYQVYVRKRPYLDYFLETVSKSFEIVVFTASQRVYADVLLDQIDPEKKLIGHRIFREACLLVQGNYLKDLEVLGRDLTKSVLVDNSPHAYGYQIDNGIPIESWYDDDTDTELLKLIGFLKKIHSADDVRPIIREHFKTYQLISNAKQGLPYNPVAPPF